MRPRKKDAGPGERAVRPSARGAPAPPDEDPGTPRKRERVRQARPREERVADLTDEPGTKERATRPRLSVKPRQPTDPAAYYLLLGVTLSLAVFGVVMIFSAGTGIGLTRLSDAFFFARRQALWLLIGLIALGIFSRLDYRRLGPLPDMAWWGSVGLLVAVWIPGLGWTSNGATRWIRIGDFTIQPSEIAKLVVLVCVAQAISRLKLQRLTLADVGPVFMRYVFVPFLLVLLEPDMGTAMALAIGPVIICCVSGLRLTDIGLFLAGGGALATVAILMEPYRIRRIISFADPFKDAQDGGYQMVQSLLAFGSGGLTGSGLGAGRQKFLYLPAAHTDFILAVVGEELGLLGTLAVVVGFALFVYAGVRIALKARDAFGRALAGGIIGATAFQAALNMAAVTKLLPVTGVPLPFVSFGGWALLTTLAGVGLVLSVATPVGPRKEPREDSREWWRDGGARVPRDRAGARAGRAARSA